jgi:hypothetical protein
MTSEIAWKGKWKIEVIDSKTRQLIDSTEVNNRIMDAVLDELVKILQGEATDLKIEYMALGTSNVAIANNQTQLGAEIFRTTPVQFDSLTTGTLTTKFIVLDSEAVGQIEEIGIFGGSTATGTANTGTLISRILWSRNKTANEEIQFTRTDRMVR